MLIGSDPDRAPRRVNRWGYVREEQGPKGVSMVGVMKKSDEESLDEAKSRVANEGSEGYVFKLIRAQARDGALTSTTSTGRFTRDYTYRELADLVTAFSLPHVTTAAPKQARLEAGVKPGFLLALADLMHETVASFSRSGQQGLTRRSSAFAYNGRVFDVTLDPPRVLRNQQYGERTYTRLLQGDFVMRNRATGKKESFSIVFGAEGDIQEVPIFISYQPRWWFKAELVLDEKQRF